MSDHSPDEWKMCVHSIPGAMHLRRGLPNQDAALTPEREHGPLMVALADGHGSRRSHRSAEGSRLGCAAAIATQRDLLATATEDNWKQAARAAARKLPAALVKRWRDRVLRHLEQNPLTDTSRQALSMEIPEENEIPDGLDAASPYVVYGSTCLCTAVLPGGLFFGQLGDGDIIVVDTEGRTHRPLPPDTRHFANETTSLCSPDAAETMRCGVVSVAGPYTPELVLLSTDGYANSFASEADFLRVATDLREMIREDGFATVSADMVTWLKEASEKGSGDDITVGLLYRSPDPQA